MKHRWIYKSYLVKIFSLPFIVWLTVIDRSNYCIGCCHFIKECTDSLYWYTFSLFLSCLRSLETQPEKQEYSPRQLFDKIFSSSSWSKGQMNSVFVNEISFVQMINYRDAAALAQSAVPSVFRTGPGSLARISASQISSIYFKWTKSF